ncbi:methyltransferase [Geodermatophilus chilensis]|uniref:methyltransferase n=1 Tax=Geodermatophilus chilensis TaxID=2035835 RepID=UPI000C25E994|nr:methyltransferase [Geodermatophilus chilensis]
MTTDQATPEGILQLGLGFWGSKTLLSAVELGVFTLLAEGPRTGESVRARLGLQPRGADDFLDALVSLGMLQRTDDEYANTAATELFLDRNKPSYIGGILEMANARLYPFWGSLTEALRTGQPQNELKTGEDFFPALYQDPDRLQQFLHAMTGLTMGAALAIAEKFPWERHQSVMDVGTAEGCLPVQLALRHAHLNAGGFDLPPVRPVFEAYAQSFGLADRVRFHAGDFFADDLPPADVLVMGRILHDWGLDQKLTLLKKGYDALPAGGALIVYDTVIDDDRRENTFGLLMSLNMLIEMEAGFDYTGAQCRSWMAEVGFRESYVEHLVGPDSMVVGIK